MRHLLAALAALLLASPAMADWVNTQGNSCAAISPGQCCSHLVTSALTDPSPLLIAGRIVQIRMASGASVNLYVGDGDDTPATAAPYQWDTNGDGIPDNQTLDGATTSKIGLQNVSVAGNLIVDPISHTSNAAISVCAVSQ